MEDVPPGNYSKHSRSPFRESRWFTRGWTLQELLAPKRREFFDSSWRRIFFDRETRQSYWETGLDPGHPAEERLLSQITGIPEGYF